MKTLDTLLEITIYSGVLFAAILLLKGCFGSKMSPFLHFAVWGLLVARLMMPVTLESSVHLFVLPAEKQAGAVAEKAQPQMPPLAVVSAANASNTADMQPQAPNAGRQSQTPTTSVPTLPARQPALSAQEIILLVWLAGAGLGVLYLLVLHCSLRAKIRRNAAPPSRRLLALLGEVKGELGVKTDVKLVCQYEYGTPAMLFPRTLLMPIDALTAMDDEQVKFALRHELTHFRRGDPITVLLLSVLNAVYWFNPIVWIACKRIRADMETACDSAVVRRLDARQRSRYASLVVDLFARPAHRQLALGMAQGGTRRMAEQRIRGIFMESRSKRSAKAVSIALAAALLLGCFTTACQPTPTKPPVVQKDQDRLLRTATPQPTSDNPGGGTAAPAQSLAGQVGAPQRYQQEMELAGGKLTLSADAAVWTPDGAAMPVVRVTAADFSQRQVDGLLKALFGGKMVYEIRRGKLSKEEIDERILQYKKQKLDPEFDQAHLDEMIGKLLEARKTAPDKADVQILQSNGMLRLTDSLDQYGNLQYRYMGLSVTNAPNDTTDTARFTMENNNDLKESLVYKGTDGSVSGIRPLRRRASLRYNYYADMDKTVDWGYEDVTPLDGTSDIPDADARKVLHTTPSEALQKAKDFLASAGIADMAVRSIGLVTDSTQAVYGNDGKEIEPEKGHYAYYLQFNRVVSGVPCAYLTGESSTLDVGESIKQALMDPDRMKFAGFWSYETMDMVLDDSGILKLDWTSPLNVGETLNAQAVLLPFPEIAQRFEEQIKVTYEPQAKQENVKSMRFQIADVRLELQRISEKDSFETGLLVPVWNFYGMTVTQYAGTPDDGQPARGLLMTVNAVDGSIIDPSLGY